MLKKLWIIASLTAVLGGCLWAFDARLVPDMTDLDKAYIPALGLTGQVGDTPKSQLAMKKLVEAWKAFQARWINAPEFDDAWKGELAKIAGMVAEADALLVAHEATASHEALEGVRTTLLAARSRLGVPYYIDSLTEFHTVMEELLGLGATSDAAVFQKDWDRAVALWQKAKPAADAPKGAPEQWAALERLFAKGTQSLASGTQPSAADLGQIKPLFTKTFFLFGDFPK